MELRQIKTFTTVATLLNFNRAADVLHYSQSTVSAQIKALEEDFGVPLFDRLGKRVVLTEAGQVFFKYAEKLLSLQDETYAQVSGREVPRGMLSLRAPQSISTYFLPPVIESFNAQFPQVSMDISTCAFHNLQQELKSGIVDVAFLLTETFNSQELKSELLGIEQLVVVSSARDALAAREHIGPADLEGRAVLVPKHDCSYRMVMEQTLSEAGVQLAKTIEYNSIEGIKQCLQRGIGVSILPRIAVRQLIAQKRLVELPWSEGPLETAILMIWHKDKWLSPAVKFFMDAARGIITQASGYKAAPDGSDSSPHQGNYVTMEATP